VLSESGHVYAWGQNHKGQVGTGDYQDYSRPKRLKVGDQTVAQVVCGSNVTVALADNGEVYACGEGMNGRTRTAHLRITKKRARGSALVHVSRVSF
jgi:alpha-tubulin suppressor-like RCC1 family protein